MWGLYIENYLSADIRWYEIISFFCCGELTPENCPSNLDTSCAFNCRWALNG
jgi:hypothetical protein